MSMRFRKTVKICKGVKVNFSKSGASLSVGGRGHSLNYSTKGVRGTVGIPGTGISYSSMLSSNSNKVVRSASHSIPIGSFTIKMNDKGQVSFFSENGIQITDQSMLRKIKATEQYQAQKIQLESIRQQKMTEMMDNSRIENEKFINIYKLAIPVCTEEEVSKVIDALVPEKYQRETFSVAAPDEAALMQELIEEAKTAVTGSIFTVKKRRKQFVQENFPVRLQNATEQWNQQRIAFEYEQDSIEQAKNAEFANQYSLYIEKLSKEVEGQHSAICESIDEWISGCTLPVEIDISYEWNQASGVAMLDVDLPEIEDLPTTQIVRLENGNIKEKKKTQTQLKEQYSTMVFGLAVFITSHIFNVSPAIKKILISGYTQRRNKTGEVQDDYIYSLKFTRDLFEQGKHLGDMPNLFCMSVENRCNQTSTGMFKAIVPFDEFE